MNDHPSATLTAVITRMIERERIGFQKYGTTVDRTDLKLSDWLKHSIEEKSDDLLYTQRALEEAGRLAAKVAELEKALAVSEYDVRYLREKVKETRAALGCRDDDYLPAAAAGLVSDRDALQAKLTAEEESHAWDISPAMAQHRIDTLTAERDALRAQLAAGIHGTVDRIGDDPETGEPRLVILTTREALMRHASRLLFKDVIVILKP